MRLRLALSVVLLLGCLAAESYGWGQAGHKIIGSIAHRRLTPIQRQGIAALLLQHPRFAADFEDEMPSSLEEHQVDEWIFQQAAIWPDFPRDFSGALKAKFHRGPWHFINQPIFLTPADKRRWRAACW